MPLSDPTEREPLHRRRYVFDGYRRADGLWDIEGRIVDTKAYTFANHDRGTIPAGEPLHEMAVRLTLDDDFTIRDIEAATDHGPFTVCPGATANYRALIGHSVGTGWRRTLRKVVGGWAGCTHITELLGAMGTVAFQTIGPARAKREGDGGGDGERGLIGTCHAFRRDGPVVRRQWPEHATPPDDDG
jgi:hypothetical protein